MSRHRKRPPENGKAIAATDTAVPPVAPASESGPTPAAMDIQPVSTGPLWLAVGLALAWWLTLAALCLFTANPPLVNYLQLSRSHYVVTAQIDNPASGQITVTRDWGLRPQWLPPLQTGSLKIANWEKVIGRKGPGEYLVPLTFQAQTYQVTAVPPGERTREIKPQIYPATRASEEQLRRILAELQKATDKVNSRM